MKIKSYRGKIGLVKSLKKLVGNKYEDLFVAVIVHGSLATNEVKPFSDFDGLIIVKDVFVDSNELKQFKKDSMKLILKFDPLQHHGWFQITESQLSDYPESYLPITVLKNSKILYPFSAEIDIKIDIKHKPDYKVGLFNMINQLENKVLNKWKPKNMFQLKSFLSQIMLVPCLYYSAKNDEGIFKRESFDAVKDVFKQKEWLVIEIASQIRNEWNPQLNSLQRLALYQPNRLFRKAVVKFMPISIPKKHLDLIDDNFYESLVLLIQKIKKEI